MPEVILFSRPLRDITTLKGAYVLLNYPIIQTRPSFLPPSCNLPYLASSIPNVKKGLQNCHLPEDLRSYFLVCHQFGSNKYLQKFSISLDILTLTFTWHSLQDSEEAHSQPRLGPGPGARYQQGPTVPH